MRKFKVLGIALTLVLIAALMAVASGATSAYFSDTKSGVITGTIGSIKVTTSGGIGTDGLHFSWANMLPGEVYSSTATFQNSGDNVQDVYLVFPNATALSALNSLGRYGAVRISVNGVGIYYNNNLNGFPNNGTEGLPSQIKLASNLGPTASGTVKFEFQYAPRMSTQEPGGVFNFYPVPLVGAQDSRNATGYGQQIVIPADGSGNGLPYRIVATQPGIDPGTTFAPGEGYAGF